MAKAKKVSRFAGVKAAGDRAPLLHAGRYRVRLTENTVSSESGNEYFKLFGEVQKVLEYKGPEGERPEEGTNALIALMCLSGKASRPTLSRVKRLAIVISGCANEAEFDEVDPDALLAEHILGEGDGKDGDGKDLPALEGMVLDVTVLRGKERDDGDYYRDHVFALPGAE